MGIRSAGRGNASDLLLELEDRTYEPRRSEESKAEVQKITLHMIFEARQNQNNSTARQTLTG